MGLERWLRFLPSILTDNLSLIPETVPWVVCLLTSTGTPWLPGRSLQQDDYNVCVCVYPWGVHAILLMWRSKVNSSVNTYLLPCLRQSLATASYNWLVGEGRELERWLTR